MHLSFPLPICPFVLFHASSWFDKVHQAVFLSSSVFLFHLQMLQQQTSVFACEPKAIKTMYCSSFGETLRNMNFSSLPEMLSDSRQPLSVARRSHDRALVSTHSRVDNKDTALGSRAPRLRPVECALSLCRFRATRQVPSEIYNSQCSHWSVVRHTSLCSSMRSPTMYSSVTFQTFTSCRAC